MSEHSDKIKAGGGGGGGGILNLYIKIIMKHFNLTANKTFLKGHSVFPWKSFSVTAFHKKYIN